MTIVNGIQFSRNIRSIRSNIENNSAKLVREVSKQTLRVLVKGTPVDTGLARSNWRVSVGGRASAIIQPYFPGFELGIGETANATAAISVGIAKINSLRSSVRRRGEAGQSVTISNSVDYIGDLRQGGSPQQPNDWVEDATREALASIPTIRLIY